MGLSEVSDYLAGFFFRRMLDGSGRANSITARAEHYAVVWIFHDGPLFSVIFFKFVRAEFAVVHAFSAADAFLVVYHWVPRYLAAGNSVPSFFRHLLSPFLIACLFCTHINSNF